jgi:hypothetical protein
LKDPHHVPKHFCRGHSLNNLQSLQWAAGNQAAELKHTSGDCMPNFLVLVMEEELNVMVIVIH